VKDCAAGAQSAFASRARTRMAFSTKSASNCRNTVLDGSVRQGGDKLRSPPSSSNVADGFHLWSETYDGDMKDILAVAKRRGEQRGPGLQIYS